MSSDICSFHGYKEPCPVCAKEGKTVYVDYHEPLDNEMISDAERDVSFVSPTYFVERGTPEDEKKVLEKKIKDRVKLVLTKYECWQFWPVSNGMGKHGIPDCIFCYRGRFGSIECKKPGRRGEEDQGLSSQQVRQGAAIQQAQGNFRIVDGWADIKLLKQWLEEVKQGGL
jgi:hypothetical protein